MWWNRRNMGCLYIVYAQTMVCCYFSDVFLLFILSIMDNPLLFSVLRFLFFQYLNLLFSRSDITISI